MEERQMVWANYQATTSLLSLRAALLAFLFVPQAPLPARPPAMSP